jgi:hypothetical protein
MWNRTAQNRHFVGQLARQERRQNYLKRVSELSASPSILATNVQDSESLPDGDPNLPYQVANGQRLYDDIRVLVSDTQNDPAMKVCT